MNEYCRYAGCDFTAEDTDEKLYAPYCRNCDRRDPMAELMLAKLEREQDAMIELDEDWTAHPDGSFSRLCDDGRELTISRSRVTAVSEPENDYYEYAVIVRLLEREPNAKRGRVVSEFPSVAKAVLAARVAERAPYLDEPPF